MYKEVTTKFILAIMLFLIGLYFVLTYKSDDVIEIPQLGTKHSLNISVSVGVILWNSVFK